MRVLVFGNSHVGAWRDAWDGAGQGGAGQGGVGQGGVGIDGAEGVEMAFFAVPEKLHARYRLRGKGIFAPRHVVTEEERARARALNGGRDQVDLASYDVAVHVGVAWFPERAAELAALGDPFGVEFGDEFGVGFGVGGGRAAYGAGFLDAALDEAAGAVVAGWGIDPNLKRRPFIYGRPVYAETCIASQHRLYAPWRAAAGQPVVAAAFLAMWRARLERVASAQGVRFVAPPAGLGRDWGPTRAEYLVQGGGVVVAGAADARGDHSHMNAAYGRAAIGHFLRQARARMDEPAVPA